jgi:hypothetical protein
MLRKTLATHTGLGLLLLAMACGDDSKGDGDEQPTGQVAPDGGLIVTRSDAGGGTGSRGDIDAGVGLDGAIADGVTPPVTAPDGAVIGVVSDAGPGTPTTPGSTLDAAVPDAGPTSGNDASTVADTGTPVITPDAGDCSINDPAFGCGTAITPTWVRFDNGYEVDRALGRVWSPTIVGATPEQLSNYCTTLTVADVTHVFDIPEIDEVRTLAAGCGATVPDGACPIKQEAWAPSAGATCSCVGVASGPHASGGFCRPEVSNCDILTTRTYCGPSEECSGYQRWYYDVRNGSIVLENSELTQLAKGRCVSDWLTVP